ncbi:MAG: cadherin-like domain-containing protein, partial [Halioglobus sp.]|nr:cadherin-like domain-containing protein [Halioglobus sp.]
MKKNGSNDRDLSTEHLFALGDRKHQRLREEDERTTQSAANDEELSLQNIFIDKSEDGDDPSARADAGRGSRSGADGEREESRGSEREGDAGLHARFGLTGSDEQAGIAAPRDSGDDAGAALGERAPILLTSVDLLVGTADLGAVPSEVHIDSRFGSVFDNGDNTWTFRPADNYDGGSLPVSFVITRDGEEVTVENEVDVVVETPVGQPPVDAVSPAAPPQQETAQSDAPAAQTPVDDVPPGAPPQVETAQPETPAAQTPVDDVPPAAPPQAETAQPETPAAQTPVDDVPPAAPPQAETAQPETPAAQTPADDVPPGAPPQAEALQ